MERFGRRSPLFREKPVSFDAGFFYALAVYKKVSNESPEFEIPPGLFGRFEGQGNFIDAVYVTLVRSLRCRRIFRVHSATPLLSTVTQNKNASHIPDANAHGCDQGTDEVGLDGVSRRQ